MAQSLMFMMIMINIHAPFFIIADYDFGFIVGNGSIDLYVLSDNIIWLPYLHDHFVPNRFWYTLTPVFIA
jgi:hypothetical protein